MTDPMGEGIPAGYDAPVRRTPRSVKGDVDEPAGRNLAHPSQRRACSPTDPTHATLASTPPDHAQPSVRLLPAALHQRQRGETKRHEDQRRRLGNVRPLAPLDEVEDILHEVESHAELTIIEGGRHAQLAHTEAEKYNQALLDLIHRAESSGGSF